MKFIHHTLIQISLAMLSGILLAFHFSTTIFLLPFVVLGAGILCFIWWRQRKKLHTNPLFELITMVLFAGIGYTNFQLYQPYFQKYHYSKIIVEKTPYAIQLKIKETLKPSTFQEKYIAEIIQINGQKSKGKVLFNLQKEVEYTAFKVDDLVWLQTSITTLPIPTNPNLFDYKKYLQHLGVHYQIVAANYEIYATKKGSNTLKGVAEKYRNHLIEKLSETTIDKDERSIMEALILGQRRNIDPEVYRAYAAAGAIHILAVSGLHVGIIFYLLTGILSPLVHLKFGKPLRSILIVVLLWVFAFIAGLSPSVVRAVTMFSFFAVATMLNRPTNSMNILFLSFFVLLIYNPNWIFQVGFQLSYIAVFSILWIQPKLAKLYKPRFKIDKLLWDIATVTLAAQLGIAPLSVFYFHQFPGLFFISNLMILPFLTFLLSYGILVVFLAAFSLLPEFIANGYNFLLKQLNYFIQWIAEKDQFIFQNITLSIWEMAGFYLFIIALILAWKQVSRKWILIALGCIIFILSFTYFERKMGKETLVIFHKPRKTLMGVTINDTLKIFQKDTLINKNEYPIKGFLTINNSKIVIREDFPDTFTFKNQAYLVLDSLGIYPKRKGVVVILTESPKVNLDRLIDSIQPRLIIADGNNFKSYKNRWKKTCEKRQIPFYATLEKGAYVVN